MTEITPVWSSLSFGCLVSELYKVLPCEKSQRLLYKQPFLFYYFGKKKLLLEYTQSSTIPLCHTYIVHLLQVFMNISNSGTEIFHDCLKYLCQKNKSSERFW